MKADITELLTIFDELSPSTEEERGYYWFITNRADGLKIDFTISLNKSTAWVCISQNETGIVDVAMTGCSLVRVLDVERKCLEVVHENSSARCFISLIGDSIVSYDEEHETS